ncbi:MAG: DUF308 domain-containing protein [Bradyrhizobium sp.]
MMVGMLIAGIGLVLAGLLATGYGITINEFSTGNTLILTGVNGVCAGAIMLGLWVAVRELQNIARRLGGDVALQRGEAVVRPVLPPGLSREPASSDAAPPSNQGAAENAGGAESGASAAPPPWLDEAATRERPRGDAAAEPEPVEAAPAKPKRNLLFSSTSRKERERAQARTSEPLPPDLLSADLRPNPPAVPPPPVPAEAPPPTFDDAWPKPERSKPGEVPQRRPPLPPRASSTLTESNGTPTRTDEQPAVTVLKSGVVDGMAYSLYSDGSIEAQMPEGMMRFASIDELRSHLDQRP